MELTYQRKGDYLFPNIAVEEKEEPAVIGKYGMLCRTYLKENRKGWYQSMLLSGKLDRHLLEVEKAANERMEVLMDAMEARFLAPDKEADSLAWAAHMNSLTAMAEEVVLRELVYC